MESSRGIKVEVQDPTNTLYVLIWAVIAVLCRRLLYT